MERLILGGYTKRGNMGISSVILNPQAKRLENVTLVAKLESPTYVEKVGDFLFSIIKEGDWAGVALLEKKQSNYQIMVTGMTKGVNPPCYVSYDSSRQLIFNANYHQGFFQVMAITDDGLEVVCDVQHEGSSVHENQKSPHVHYVKMDKTNEKLLVCDLGTDEVYAYEVDQNGQANEFSRHAMKKGFGPRHLVEHPTLPLVYIVGELANEIAICTYQKGIFEVVDYVSLLPSDYDKFSSGGAIRITKNGQFLYASNRGHNSLVVYKVENDGKLVPIQWIDTTGHTPRDFNFNQDETFIIVGHQDDDVLALFERNVDSGLLTLVDNKARAMECVCIV